LKTYYDRKTKKISRPCILALGLDNTCDESDENTPFSETLEEDEHPGSELEIDVGQLFGFCWFWQTTENLPAKYIGNVVYVWRKGERIAEPGYAIW
jgi:hypothetical protein